MNADGLCARIRAASERLTAIQAQAAARPGDPAVLAESLETLSLCVEDLRGVERDLARLPGEPYAAEEARQAVREAEALGRLAVRLAAAASVHAVTEAVREETALLLGWDAYYFAIRSAREGEFEVVSFVDTVGGRQQAFPGETWAVCEPGTPILINRTAGETEPILAPFGDAAHRSGSLMFVPVRSGDAVLGVISAQSYTPGRYGPADMRLLQRVADTVAPALVRAFAEDALRASEERYQAVVDDQTDVVCRFRPDGTFVFVNEACCRLFGKSKAELLGSTCASVVHPDYLDRVGAELASLSPSNPVAVIENGILAADGNVRWMQSVCRGLYDAHGNLVEIQAVGRDLTERKRVEDLLRQERDRAQHYLDIAEVMFVAIDTQENVTLINKKGCEILRCAEEEVLGRNWFDHFVPAPERERARAVFARLIAGEVAPAPHYQNAVLTRDGGTRMMAWHNTVVRDASGRIVGTLSSGEDITERLRAEEEARQRQAELAHVLRVSTVGAMASSLAHELSQPLTAVTSYLRGCQRRLRAGKVDLESLGRAIASAIEQAERAGEIVQTVRTFLQRGEVRRTRVDLNRVVRGAVTLVAAEADRQGIAVRLALCPELPPTSANPVQIEQVILNLIRNGLEAMSQVAGAARELRIETAVSENGGLEVAVADSGPGLGVEDPDRIFSPFFTTKPEGLGMGLSISRTIVEAHGGRLWVTPNGEGGCTFRFTLPAVTHER